MKRFLITAFILISATCTVGAAAVYPSSPSNYLFSTPLWPAHIRGEVMGTPPAYRVPRSEDADWIVEAFGERAALYTGRMPYPGTSIRPTFGKWPLSETNRFYRWATAVDVSGVTNIVVGYNIVTNHFTSRVNLGTPRIEKIYTKIGSALSDSIVLWNPTSASDSYLDPAEPLSDIARAAYQSDHAPSFTNAYLYPTAEHVPTNSFSTIEMPMTNGTMSVYTNKWSETMRRPVYGVATNVSDARPLDYCHAGAGQFPGYAGSMDSLYDLGFSPGVFSNLYNSLRHATRLSDTTEITNGANGVSYTKSKYTDGSGSIITDTVTTNSFHSSPYYSFSADGTDDYGWNSERQDYDVYDRYYVDQSATPAFETVSATRFKSDLVTTGNAERVTIEGAFAVVDFQYIKELDVGVPPYHEFETNVLIDSFVVVPLANASLDLSGADVLARVNIDIEALAGSAAEATGAPSPPGVSYTPANNERISWDVDCESIVLIYKIHPSSKLSSW